MPDRVELSAAEWRQRALHHAWALRALLAPREPEDGSMTAGMLDEARESLRAGGAEATVFDRALPRLFPDPEYVPTEHGLRLVQR